MLSVFPKNLSNCNLIIEYLLVVARDVNIYRGKIKTDGQVETPDVSSVNIIEVWV